MALIGNYCVLNKAPMRQLTGNGTAHASGIGQNGMTPANRMLVSNWKPFGLQDACGSLTTGASLKFASKPYGYYPTAAWGMAVTAGGVSSYQRIVGTGTTPPPNLAGGVNGVAPLVGSGSVNASSLTALAIALAALTGSGATTNAAGVPIGVLVASLVGSSTTDGAVLTGQLSAIASLVGSGAITNAAGITLSTAAIVASLTGSGALTSALLNALAVAQASPTGAGDLTNAAGVSTFPGTATLTGSGLVSTAVTNGLGWATAAPTGAGTATSALATALGTLGATLLSYSALTPEGIRDSIWGRVIESGMTAEQILRIIASHAAGSATGLEGAHPVFMGLDGTTTRIDGTYASGTRTINSLNGG